MLYLRRFRLPEREAEELYWGSGAPKTKRTCYDSNYPFGLFLQRPVPPLDFEPVTILYGGNGSGKSTILNLIAHCLRLPRGTDCNTSAFFADYAALCGHEAQRLPEGSRILTSDDVFAAVLSLRADSDAVDARRETLLEDYHQLHREPCQLASLDDYAEFRCSVDAKRLTQSKFVRARRWSELENVRSYYDFFRAHRAEFEETEEEG